jgi:hypothetical protein
MLSINNRLGFKIYKEKVTAQIKVEDALISLENLQKLESVNLHTI